MRYRDYLQRRAILVLSSVLIVCTAQSMQASDHADPIDPLNRERQEGGITDLFVFPVLADDRPAFGFVRTAGLPLGDILANGVRKPLTPDEFSQIDALVMILCVRRQLTQTGSLMLEPYSYKIHIDLDSSVEFPTEADELAERSLSHSASEGAATSGYHSHASDEQQSRPTLLEAFVRYGGRISKPASIAEDLTIEFRLDNQARFQDEFPRYTGASSAEWSGGSKIRVASGVFDDPFIFPAFFGTNVVSMIIRVPIKLFPTDKHNYLIWATSHLGKRQVDHVGRSLRTQNPRFELLNTLHPSQHVQAISNEHARPGLFRDIALRLNFAQTFAYRKWDFVPDVMCYSTQYPVGFPNGRLLTDDVAAMLAQHGDTLLYELSYQHNNGRWPRQNMNDSHHGVFAAEFPFLLPPFPDRPQPVAPRLSTLSIMKLIAIAVLLIGLIVFENWLVARIYHRIKSRRRYL